MNKQRATFLTSILQVITQNWPVVLLLVGAAFLRLYRIRDYITFLGDEGRDVLVVYNILHGKLTLLGPTASVGGFFHGPLYYYFMTPFLFLTNFDPVGPAIMIALIGIVTVLLVYIVGKRLFGTAAGFIAALLYTISPVVIAYSRSSWNPNPMPFFSLITAITTYYAVKKKSLVLFFIIGVLFGVLLQLHYLELFFMLAMAVFIAFTTLWKQPRFKGIKALLTIYLVIFGGTLVGWAPFLAFEVRHDFMNIRSIVSFVFAAKDTGADTNFFVTVWNVFYKLFARLVVHFPMPSEVASYPTGEVVRWYIGSTVLALGSVGIFLYQMKKAYKENYDKFLAYLLLFVWLFFGIILFGFYKKPVYDYYLGFLFPIPFLLVGNGLVFLYSKKIKNTISSYLAKAGIALIVVLLLVVNLQSNLLLTPPNRQLDQAERISRVVFEKAENKPYNFAIITGGNSDHAYRYFFTMWGNPPVTIENAVVDPERKTVTDQLFVVCESLPCEPLGHSLWEIAGFGRANIVEIWKENPVEIYKLDHYKGE